MCRAAPRLQSGEPPRWVSPAAQPWLPPMFQNAPLEGLEDQVASLTRACAHQVPGCSWQWGSTGLCWTLHHGCCWAATRYRLTVYSWMPVAVAWSPECCVSNHQNALWAPSHTSEPISADDTQVTRGSHACRWHCRDLGSGPELQAMHGTALLAPNHRPSGACTGPCQHRCSPILCSCQLW